MLFELQDNLPCDSVDFSLTDPASELPMQDLVIKFRMVGYYVSEVDLGPHIVVAPAAQQMYAARKQLAHPCVP